MTRRRGLTLIHMITILPIIAAIFTVCFQLSSRGMRLQCLESRQISDDARVRDMLRRIQRDVGLADIAVVEKTGEAVQLKLTRSGGEVLYKSDAGGVTRTEVIVGEVEQTFSWTMERVRLDFMIEEVRSRPGVVWILFERRSRGVRGPGSVIKMSAAATVGRGGL